MTLPELSEQYHREEEELSENDDDVEDSEDIFGPTRTFTFRAKNKLSMISSELRMREKRKRVLQLCLRKLERIKDSENNLRISVIIHNTYSRLTADIKRDKLRGQNKYQQQYQQQQQNKEKSSQQKNQNSPKKIDRKLDLENLEELCSIEDNDICPLVHHDPILKNSEEIEQALSRKRKAEEALLSYHQLEKRLKSEAFSQDMAMAVSEGQYDLNNMQCNNNNSNNNNNNLLNGFQCGKAAALDSSNGIFQSLVVKSLET